MQLSFFFISKKTILLHFLILTIPLSIFAQADSSFVKKPDSRYYSIRTGKWAAHAKLLQISPEIHGFKYLTIGLNLVKMKTETGEGGGNAKAYQFGFEYLPTKNIFAPKIAAWKGGYAFGFGGKVGINGLYYFKKNASSFAIRPMIGFGVVYFQFNYGYTFFVNNKFGELSPHSFSLSWHHLIFPKAKK